MHPSSAHVATPLVEVVQSLYAAFARGDIPALLAKLSSEVEWQLNVDLATPGAKRIPNFRPFRGREGVRAFFSIIGEEIEFHTFQPTSFLASGNDVMVRVQMEFTVKSTGRRAQLESLHLITFDVNGAVTRFVEYLDTLAVAYAWDAIDPKP